MYRGLEGGQHLLLRGHPQQQCGEQAGQGGELQVIRCNVVREDEPNDKFILPEASLAGHCNDIECLPPTALGFVCNAWD